MSQTAKATTNTRRRPRFSAGFTVVELTMTLVVIVLVMTGVLALFDANSELARSQTHLAGMQQSLRVAQYEMVRNVRMTGRGPLPQGNLPSGAALAIDNNVDPGTHLDPDDTLSPLVVENTDILTIRGVLNSPLYQFSPTGAAYSLNGTPGSASGGTLVITNRTPTGIPQDLQPIADAIDAEHPEALLIVSPIDDAIYAVVEIDQNSSSYTEETVDGATQVTQASIEFKISGGRRTDAYAALSAGGAYPSNMATASFAGLLEEYRYYIREVRAVEGDTNSELHPRLSRARTYPGTDTPHDEDEDNWQSDIADNVLDLQVALAIDSNNDDLITESDPPDGSDDWLYNSSDDDATDTGKWVGLAGNVRDLYYVRINTLVRTDRQDRGFLADLLTTIEDRVYPQSDIYNSPQQRAYRRTLMQSVVATRNVP